MKHYLSRLDDVYDVSPRAYPLSVLLKEVRTGATSVSNPAPDFEHKSLRKYTAYVRSFLENPDHHQIYDGLKKGLPQLCPAGVLDNRSEIATFSGLVCLEYDAPDLDFDFIFAEAAQNPHTVAAFRSPSRKPKLLIHVSDMSLCGQPLSAENFKHAWAAADRIYEAHGDADTGAMSPTHLQAFCYDPNVYVNLDAIPLGWDIDESEIQAKYGNKAIGTAMWGGMLSQLPERHQDVISELSSEEAFGLDGWSNRLIPCPWQHHEHDSWEHDKGNATSVKKVSDTDYILHCFKCSRSERFGPRQRRGPIRLFKENSEGAKMKMLPLETARKLITKQVNDFHQRTKKSENQHILILEHTAGVGKSTAVLLSLDQFLDLSPTGKLADERYEKAIDAGKVAVRHRSRMHNREAAAGQDPHRVRLGLEAARGEVPCAFPDKPNLLAERGYPAFLYCRHACPRFDECEDVGYLSQYETMKEYDLIFTALPPEYITDASYLPYIRNRFGVDRDAFIDDCDPTQLLQRRHVPVGALTQLILDYKTHDSSLFLKYLIRNISTAATAVAFVEAVRDAIDFFSDVLDALEHQLGGIPVRVTFQKLDTPLQSLTGETISHTIANVFYRDMMRECFVIHPDDTLSFEMHSTGHYLPSSIYPEGGWEKGRTYHKILYPQTFIRIFDIFESENTLAHLPPNTSKLVSDLRAFVSISDDKFPPCHPEGDGWTYYLPPTLNTRRALFASASGWGKNIEKMYAGTDVQIEICTGETQLKPSIRVYQIPYGLLTPAQSLFERENGEPARLRYRGLQFLEMIRNVAETLPDKQILVAAPAAFTIDGHLAALPEIAALHNMEHVAMVSHAQAIGTNRYEDFDIVFVFNFTPPPDELKRIVEKTYMTNDIAFDREQVTLRKAGLRFENVNRYKDPRVQEMFDLLSEKTMMQSAMRLRPNLHENKTIFLLTSEPIRLGDADAHIFEIENLDTFLTENKSLDGFETYLAELSKRDIEDIVQAEGITGRHAYRRNSDTRQVSKAERNAEILKLHNEGKSMREIAKILGINVSTVSRVLQN